MLTTHFNTPTRHWLLLLLGLTIGILLVIPNVQASNRQSGLHQELQTH